MGPSVVTESSVRSTLSVIICAHNPRQDYIERVLAALRAQTLPVAHWELLLIDNASQHALAERFDLSWHPAARHLDERKLGLTEARLCGVNEAKGEVLVFADDDNVLAPNYLEIANEIAARYAFLGAWGGTMEPEFETTPPAWAWPHLNWLSLREVRHAQWSSNFDDWACIPYGAGLCVRRAVASTYSERTADSPRRRALGRRGASLASSEDIDIVYCCRLLELGWGVFPELIITHLIPASRLTERYLTNILYEGTKSNICLRHLWDLSLPHIAKKHVVYGQWLRNVLRRGWRSAKFEHVRMMAIEDAIEEIRKSGN
jgi:glycosyltransferase involved in cell wall biosynthesis